MDEDEDFTLGQLKSAAPAKQPAVAAHTAAKPTDLGPSAFAADDAANNDEFTSTEDDEDFCLGELQQKNTVAQAYAPVRQIPPQKATSQFVNGYECTNKYATLPGGFKLPRKLFDALYGYQRDGVSWMWSIHPESPMQAGSLGKNEYNEAAAASAPSTAAAAAAVAAMGPKIAGGILADDMGLGKTLQVLSFITGCLYGEAAATALVVLPVSLIDTWQQEFARFAPNVSVYVMHDGVTGKQRVKLIRQLQEDGGVLLTTYGLIASSPQLFGATYELEEVVSAPPEGGEEAGEGGAEEEEGQGEEEGQEDEDDGFVRRGKSGKAGHAVRATAAPGTRTVRRVLEPAVPDTVWDILVLDEGHKVKNPSTRVAKALRAVPARMRLLLSGTPIQNNLDELWALFDFVACGRLLDTRRVFNSRIANRILKARERKASAVAKKDGAEATAQLMAIIGPYLLRREKERLLNMMQQKPLPQLSTAAYAAAAAAAAAAGNADAMSALSQQMGGMALSGGRAEDGEGAGAAPAALAQQEDAGAAGGIGEMGRKKEVVLWAPLAQDQTEMYTAYLGTSTVRTALTAARAGPRGKGGSEGGGSLLEAIVTLRKITCHPLLMGQDLTSALAGQRAAVSSKECVDLDATVAEGADAAAGVGTPVDGSSQGGTEVSEVEDIAPAGWDATRLPSADVLIQSSGKVRLTALLLRAFAKEGSKVLVFSSSVRMLDILQKVTQQLYRVGPDSLGEDSSSAPAAVFCQGRSARMGDVVDEIEGRNGRDVAGLRFVRIDGGYSGQDRAAAVRAFNNDPSIAVALISTGVGSLGLTLTSATRVVIFDPSWNPSVDAQAVDRAYRVGQKKDVVTYRLITAGTIEEKMYRQQVFKSGLNATVMAARGGKAGGAGSTSLTAMRFLSAEDLRDLFKLGPCDYSATARIVDAVAPAPALPSADIARHLLCVTHPPLSTAIVGLSHHDHLFKLQPEDMAALAAAAKAEMAAQKARDKQHAAGGQTGAEEVRAVNMDGLKELVAAAGVDTVGHTGHADASTAGSLQAQHVTQEAFRSGMQQVLGEGPLVHPSVSDRPLVLFSPVRAAAKTQAEGTAARQVEAAIREHYDYAGSVSMADYGPVGNVYAPDEEGDAGNASEGQDGEGDAAQAGQGYGLEQTVAVQAAAEVHDQQPYEPYEQEQPFEGSTSDGCHEQAEELGVELQEQQDEQSVEEEEGALAPVPNSPLSPIAAETALGSTRKQSMGGKRKSMGLVRPLQEEEEAEQADGVDLNATEAYSQFDCAGDASGMHFEGGATVPLLLSAAPQAVCDAHRTGAAMLGIHGVTRCVCYAAPGSNEGSDASSLLDPAVPAEMRLHAALSALHAPGSVDADPLLHLAAMHAAAELGLLAPPAAEENVAPAQEAAGKRKSVLLGTASSQAPTASSDIRRQSHVLQGAPGRKGMGALTPLGPQRARKSLLSTTIQFDEDE